MSKFIEVDAYTDWGALDKILINTRLIERITRTMYDEAEIWLTNGENIETASMYDDVKKMLGAEDDKG